MKFYFAYGSNMNVDQFDNRCPQSTPSTGGTLKGWRLVINSRGVATIQKSKKSYIEGALYELSPEDEETLDVCEGVAGGFYQKHMLEIECDDGRTREALVYIDKNASPGRARKGYLETCLAGAKEWGLLKAAARLEHIQKNQPKAKPVAKLKQWTPQRGLALQAKASRKHRKVYVDRSRNKYHEAAKRLWEKTNSK